MGIPRGAARLLLDEHRQRPFSGSVLQLGRSSIYFGRSELESWAHRHGVELRAGVETRPSHDPRLAEQGCIDDRTFLELLGFAEVTSCDIADWEGATYVHDLNEPIPDDLAERFDVVLDPGSSLQIFHQPQLLANIHRLLKPEGRVVHAGVPSNNHIDLGFYMFSPTFFHDFYSANDWRLESEYLCQYFPYWHRGRFYSARWKIYRYTEGCLDHLNYGRFGGRQAAIFTVARKIDGASGDKVPQLGQYRRSWQEFERRRNDPAAAAGELPAAKGRWAARADAWFDAYPLLGRAYRPLKRVRERLRRALPQRMPPLVARY